ncbi:hypothetical protein B0A55_10130, partial [Friedmanniomyces simplex]
PLKEQLAWVKHWFKEGAKRAKSRNATSNAEGGKKGGKTSPKLNGENGAGATVMPSQLAGASIRDLQRTHTGPLPQHRKTSVGHRPELQSRATMPARPRINTTSSTDSRTSMQRKRSSLSPHTLTPHSSYHRRSSAGLRGRKSTSSSVSSIRSAYQSVGGGGGGGAGKGHHHTHSKASSTSSASASLASPSGMSSASGSKMGRSPHASVKVLPATPTGTSFSSGIRVSRRPPPGGLGTLPVFPENNPKGTFGVGPGSPSLPVFARRKRSVFKGPMGGGSPSGFGGRVGGNSRSGSVPRRSGEMIMGITEEDEEEDEHEDAFEDEEVDEEVDQFGPELVLAGSHVESVVAEHANLEEPVGISPVEGNGAGGVLLPVLAEVSGSKTPLTAEALAKMEEQEEEKLGAADKEKG